MIRLIPIIIVLLGLVISTTTFTVDETEQAVITQFGKPVGEAIREPGLNFKMPFIQKVTKFPNNLLEWDGDPGQIPTKDKTYLWVDTFARWRITDPLKFFQTVGTEASAQARLDDIIDPAVRNFVTSYPLLETVRISNREMDTFDTMISQTEDGPDESPDGSPDENPQDKDRSMGVVKIGRDKITKGILEQAGPKLAPFGIKLVDVKIKRINYVEEVRKSVYGRMIAERKQKAEKFRSEGKGEAQKIDGERDKALKKISSEAYRTAQELKGHADAEATSIYADAFSRDPEFYSFVNTLEVYKQTINQNNSLIMSTESDFFKYMKSYR